MGDAGPIVASLYTDEDVSDRLAVLVRQRGFGASSAWEAGLIEQPDEAHLAHAAAQGFVLLTFNQRDYVLLAQRWAADGRQHAGILLSDQFTRQEMGELLRRVLRFLDSVAASETINIVRYLSEFRYT